MFRGDFAPGGCKKLKISQRMLPRSCLQYTKEVLHAYNFIHE